jgi:hypothetical protein
MRQTARKMPHRIAPGSLQGRGDIPGQPVEVLFHLRMCAARVYHDRPRQSVAAVDTKAGRPVDPPEWEQSPSDETLHPHAYSRFSAETWVIWR